MASPAGANGVHFATDIASQLIVDINLRSAGSRETRPRLSHMSHADSLARSCLCRAMVGNTAGTIAANKKPAPTWPMATLCGT